MRVRTVSALLLLLPVLAGLGCRRHLFEHSSDVVVVNESRCDLTVFVDGWEALTIRHDSTQTVDNVGSGRHVLEAKDELGRLVERHYIELGSGEDYYWRLETCSLH